jgi:hypothetical protein
MKRSASLGAVFMFGLVFHSLLLSAQQVAIEKIRNQYFSMNKVKEGSLNLYYMLKPLDLSKNPVMLAYRGASSAAAAGTVSGPYKKLQYFSNGKAELEKAIILLPADLEIRFLRLATQLNAPAFLGYNKDIKADVSMIVSSLSLVKPHDPNAYLYSRISDFLLQSDKLDAGERKSVILSKEKFRN